jgi:3-phenylpropionate/trans-cinnamate dioxygenase ferredoxin reductase component
LPRLVEGLVIPNLRRHNRGRNRAGRIGGVVNEQVVIVGASHAGGTVAAELRAAGFAGSVTLIGAEPFAPYHRPPLSKAFLTGEKTAGSLILKADAFYADNHIDIRLRDPVTAIDRAARTVALRSGASLPYDHLILATGARVRKLPVPGADLAGVHYLRTLGHAERIKAELTDAARVVVVGAGFIGLEIAASARKLGKAVTVIEALPRPMARVLAPDLSDFFTALHRAHGVDLRLGTTTARIAGETRATGVVTGDGQTIPADLVIVGIGIVPDDDLAKAAGLATDNGILVGADLRTSDPAILAIGDVARFPHPLAEGTIRLESVQNAHDQARMVAHAIVGKPEPYAAVPWFWSDQYDVKLQMAGLSTGADAQVRRGDDASFSLFHFRAGRLIAVDSINRPADHMRARRVIGTQETVTPADLDRVFAAPVHARTAR